MSKASSNFRGLDHRPPAGAPPVTTPAASASPALKQTLDQRIAKAAHDALIQSKKEKDQDVRNAIKKTATRLRTSGLGVTVAFAASKKRDAYGEVIALWCQVLTMLKDPGCDNPQHLLKTYMDSDAHRVRILTERSERILEWLAKWADAYKEDLKEDNHARA